MTITIMTMVMVMAIYNKPYPLGEKDHEILVHNDNNNYTSLSKLHTVYLNRIDRIRRKRVKYYTSL